MQQIICHDTNDNFLRYLANKSVINRQPVLFIFQVQELKTFAVIRLPLNAFYDNFSQGMRYEKSILLNKTSRT